MANDSRDLPDAEDEASEVGYEELVRTCERLATERTRYHELFASSRDACIVTDGKGVILDANRRAGEMLGLTPEALRRKLLIAFVARNDTRSFRKSLACIGDLARSGDSVCARMRARGGSPFDAVLWVDAGPRPTTDAPATYRWTIQPAPRKADSGLHRVLGVVGRLARTLPPEEDLARHENEGGVRVGDSVVRAIQLLGPAAEQRRIRFVVDGGGDDDLVSASTSKLDEAIKALLSAAFGATPNGSQLYIRLGREDGEIVLDIHAEGVEARSLGSPLSLVLSAAHLAEVGGRLQVKMEAGQPLVHVRWPAVS